LQSQEVREYLNQKESNYDIKRRNTGIAAQHGEFSGGANGIHDEHG